MKIILSTRNPSKTLQIQAVFAGTPIEILTLDQAGIVGEAIEDGTTLEENARKKAIFAHEHRTDLETWTMADDTGLFIKALNGAPGIHAARWAGETASTDEITEHTLTKLLGATDRSAIFETCVVLLDPSGYAFVFAATCPGTILEERQCEAQPRMPYSAIFKPDVSDKVWAQMTTEEENAVSHRGLAFRTVRDFLEERLAA
jgi:XTP/dITP diphosphohydrolase